MGLALVFSLLWGGGGLALYLVMRAGLVAEFDQALDSSAQALATLTEYEQGKIEMDFTGDLMPAFERARLPDYFQLWMRDGTPLKRSPSLHSASLPRRGGPLHAPKFWNLILPDGQVGRAIGIQFVPHESERSHDKNARPIAGQDALLVLAHHRADLDRRLQLLGSTLLLVGLATVTAAAVVVAVLVRRGLRPLSSLVAHAATIDASSLELRFPTETMPSELLPICERLNDLLARLEASFVRERRFSADVAHELRTPIAELRALAEVALKWPDDVPGTTRVVQDALAIALQMQSIADGLLALARCESGLLPVLPEPVALASLIKEVFRSLANEARDRKLSLSLDVPADARWLADPALLRAILTNLLSNAVEYSPVSGSIAVRVERDGEHGRLMISNTTDNLGPDDVPHLFERFWRKDPARSSPAHCGLGLALTRAYAASLAMELRAEMADRSEIKLVLSAARICPNNG
jgi:signal transduction histidine kinase